MMSQTSTSPFAAKSNLKYENLASIGISSRESDILEDLIAMRHLLARSTKKILHAGLFGAALCGLAPLAHAADAAAAVLPAEVFAPSTTPPPAAAPLASVAVYPQEIQLTTSRDRQSIVVQATYADGSTRDVTKDCAFVAANPALVKRQGAVFTPAADGATELAVSFGGKTLKIPVKVARSKETPPLSFRLDVMPVFMRAGCNTGSCHGAALRLRP
jgi:hypothetical protein